MGYLHPSQHSYCELQAPSSKTLAVHCLHRKGISDQLTAQIYNSHSCSACVQHTLVSPAVALQVRLRGCVCVWRRVSGVRQGHLPPHAAEAVSLGRIDTVSPGDMFP